MTKKIITAGIAMSSMFMFVGCGGGSSDTTSTATTAVTTGTAYYVDSAVSGMDYACGTRSGVTASNGAFTFETGVGCSFSLGDIAFRTVDASLLVNGTTIYETDLDRAFVLQSLDSDNDVSNGITIKESIITALEQKMKDLNLPMQIPETSSAMDLMQQAIDMIGGNVITMEEAAKHMLTTALGGKTFYNVGQDINNPEDIWDGKVTFNADMTSLSYTDFYGQDAGNIEVDSIQFNDNKLMFGDNPDGSYTIIGAYHSDYIEVTDYDRFGKVESYGHLYYDKDKAEAYYKSL